MRYALWKLGFVNNDEINFKQDSLVFLLFILVWKFSYCEFFKDFKRHTKVLHVHVSKLYLNNLTHGTLYKFARRKRPSNQQAVGKL